MMKFKEFFRTKVGMKDPSGAVKIATDLGLPTSGPSEVKKPTDVSNSTSDVSVSSGIPSQVPGMN